MKKLKRGILIAVEGIDGSGKSTFIKELSKNLSSDFSLILTKEPGDTELGKQLRQTLQTQPIPITPKAEYLLFAADRAQHIHDVIKPAQKEKKLIISDRMDDSSVVYQGYARGLNPEMINTINEWAMDTIKPDLIIFIKLDHHEASKRISSRNEALTAFEKEHHNFMKKASESYLNWFEKMKKHVLILDGKKAPQKLADEAQKYIDTWLIKENIYE
jgi:dTMP kinase